MMDKTRADTAAEHAHAMMAADVFDSKELAVKVEDGDTEIADIKIMGITRLKIGGCDDVYPLRGHVII